MLECVRLGNKESWLCEMATGVAVYHRPLNRVRVFSDLMQAMIADCEDKKMASLAFDDEDSEAVETPRKAKAPSRERKKKPSVSVKSESAAGEICKRLRMPSSPRPDAQLVTVAVALDKQRRLWAHVDALPWLIEYIREEKELGGVEPVESSSVEESQSPSIYWNFRDSNWNAKAKAPDGTWFQTNRGIKRRQREDKISFQDAKAAAYAELEVWVDRVGTGDIPREDQVM